MANLRIKYSFTVTFEVMYRRIKARENKNYHPLSLSLSKKQFRRSFDRSVLQISKNLDAQGVVTMAMIFRTDYSDYLETISISRTWINFYDRIFEKKRRKKEREKEKKSSPRNIKNL